MTLAIFSLQQITQNICGCFPFTAFGPEPSVFSVAVEKLKNYNIQDYNVLYGCETWSLTLREKHRLGVFENRVLRRIFGPSRDEVTGEWRRLHNESFMICTLRKV
jgi:hypothetical protein